MPYRLGDVELADLARLLVDEEASAEPRDWRRLVSRARDERVAPLLSRKLSSRASLPRDLRFELKQEAYRCGASNQLLFDELRRLLEAADRRGASSPLVLKGGALAASLYEDIALRPMSDIDVLVPAPELPLWLEAGDELGLEPTGPEMARGLGARVHHQRALANDRATIELHVGVVGGPSDWRAPEPGWLFEHSEPWRSPTPGADHPSRARQLTPTAALLYACAHAVLQHGTAQAPLLWLYDIHALVTRRRHRIDWTELVESAPPLRWGAAVADALALSRSLFGTAVPEGIEAKLQASGPELRHQRRKANPALSRAELVWRELGCVGPIDRLRWALAILFPSPTYVRWRYPGARRIWPLCYPYRWSVVVREGLAWLARARGGAGSC